MIDTNYVIFLIISILAALGVDSITKEIFGKPNFFIKFVACLLIWSWYFETH